MSTLHHPNKSQSGIVLLTALILLLVVSFLAVSLLSRSGLQSRLSSNHFQLASSFELNESALSIAFNDPTVKTETLFRIEKTVCIELDLAEVDGNLTITDISTTSNGREYGLSCSYFTTAPSAGTNKLVLRSSCVRSDAVADGYDRSVVSRYIYEYTAKTFHANGITRTHTAGYSQIAPKQDEDCIDSAIGS